MFDLSYRGLFRLFFEMLKHDLMTPLPGPTVSQLCLALKQHGVPDELLAPILAWDAERQPLPPP